MPMQLETRSREAFELVSEALEIIDEYQMSRNVSKLKDATTRLAEARVKDPNYFRAQYYDAIVDDLSGRFGTAATKLRALLDQSPPLIDEVRYNLGIAEYHGYSHSALERAIEQFKQVLSATRDESLPLRAEAGLAQAFAMHMIPKQHDDPHLPEIQKYKELADCSIANVRRGLRKARFQRWNPFKKDSIDPTTIDEIRWTMRNAKGMALMYYADYLPPAEKLQIDAGRIRQAEVVQQALVELELAEMIKGDDWANRCDLASATMRLGYYARKPGKFDEAIKILEDVVSRLRPGYGFAIYEIGRAMRLSGDFSKAIERFNTALAIPDHERDISARRINTELQRAQAKDCTFP